ncbi:MAG: DUF2851 family protein [Bacteroidia bacterium]|nr:DUF2851 family protein [Bacteroidia bacterium]
MKEEFLHFIWKNKLYQSDSLFTDEGELLQIVHQGRHNTNAGPDFFDARIRIGETLWAGNIEIHQRASDWNKHGHQNDPVYRNTILHVVAINDIQVFNDLGSGVPVLLMKWPKWIEDNYEMLIKSHDWIGCASLLYQVDPFRIKFFLNGIVIERLKQKIETISNILAETKEDWGETFYCMLARSFGLKENALPFEMVARSLPQAVLARHHDSLFQIEALLFGQAGLLGEELFGDEYYLELRKEYRFLAIKYGLKSIAGHLWKFMRMHPGNFPTIRLAQFAALIYRSRGLFTAVIEANNLEDLKQLFTVSASDYWDNHYSFNKPSVNRKKVFGDQIFRLIVINVVVPFYFLYGESQNKLILKDKALDILEQMPAEDNSSINLWARAGIEAANALESQALLQLQHNYCEPRKCLDCTIGHKIILHEPV